jgi:hypothetical protein
MHTSTRWLGLSPLVTSCGGSTPEPAEPATHSVSDQAWADQPAVGVEHEHSGAAGAEQAPGKPGSEDQRRPPGATVEETRTLDVIRAVVEKDRNKVRRCFDSLSKEEQGRGGMLTIAFKLGSRGDVQAAGLNAERSTLKQPKLVSCAIAAFKTLKFPASSRGFESNGNYPFKFKP